MSACKKSDLSAIENFESHYVILNISRLRNKFNFTPKNLKNKVFGYLVWDFLTHINYFFKNLQSLKISNNFFRSLMIFSTKSYEYGFLHL